MDTEVLVVELVTDRVLLIVQQLANRTAIVHAKTRELTELNKYQLFLLFIFETKGGSRKARKE